MSYPRPHRLIVSSEPREYKLKSLSDAINWNKGNRLNEVLHLFDKPGSPYRQKIEEIAQCLISGKNLVQRDLELYPDCFYDKYEFLNPFKHTGTFNIINNLRIYYSSDGHDACTYCSDYNDVPDSERPMFNATPDFSKINIISIVINNENDDFQELVGMLSHELRHALFIIKHTEPPVKKLSKSADFTKANGIDRDNWVYEIFQDYKCPKLPYDSLKPFRMEIENLFWKLSNLVYYTQQTELNSHLETAINDIKIEYNKSRLYYFDELKLILRTYRRHTNRYRANAISLTLENYRVLASQVIPKLKDKAEHAKFKAEYPDIYADIEKILKQGSHPNLSFYRHVLYWEKQIDKFFSKLGSLVSDFKKSVLGEDEDKLQMKLKK